MVVALAGSSQVQALSGKVLTQSKLVQVAQQRQASKAETTEVHHRLLVQQMAAVMVVSVVAVQAVQAVAQVQTTSQATPQAELVFQVKAITAATLRQEPTALAVAAALRRLALTHRLELRATAAQVRATTTTALLQPTQVAAAAVGQPQLQAVQAAAVQAARQEQREQSTEAAEAAAVLTPTAAQAAQVL